MCQPYPRLKASKPSLVLRAIKTVLIVDDSAAQRRIIAGFLTGWGLHSLQASSAKSAISLFKKHRPNIILSDWMMPKMNGLDLCDTLRQITPDLYIYFILLTSRSTKAEMLQAFQQGADDFLSKPIAAVELHARITAAARLLDTQRKLKLKNRQIKVALRKTQALNAAMDKDLIAAQQLQTALIHNRHRRFGRFDIAALVENAGPVGGDLAGFFAIGATHIEFYIADVSGHDISAAMLTVRIASFFSAEALGQNIAVKRLKTGQICPRQPHDILQSINQIMLKDVTTDHYLTMISGLLDLTSGRLCFAQAGHPYPILQAKEDSFHHIGRDSLPIGILQTARYQDHHLQLALGERLILYSDGFSDGIYDQNTALGKERLQPLFARVQHLHGPALIHNILENIHAARDQTPLVDDLSALIITHRAAGASGPETSE
jgi:sigma-B regulation protein RsbU (phosphoserine phosphatase)